MLRKPEIFEDIEQGTEEWFALRRGIPTASRFKDVMRERGRGDDGESKTRRLYLNQLAGEILTGETMKTFKNEFTERGHEQEDEARQQYEFLTENKVKRVAFIRGYRCGASPDGLIGEDGMLEIKTCEPHIMIEIWRRRLPPPEHYPQCQGNVLVAQRKWIDLAIYCRKLPLFVHRFQADATYHRELEGQIHIFNKELDKIVSEIRSAA